MNEPEDRLRPLITRMAQRLVAMDGADIVAQLQGLGRTIASAPGRVIRFRRTFPTHVGVWEIKKGPVGREFIRDPTRFPGWRAFADVDRISAKSKKKRVVLIGGSVSRGLFFDPAHTPAKVLQAVLNGEDDSYEVVDLAKTAISPSKLAVLLRQMPALEPDILVFLGGNNWHCGLAAGELSAADLSALAVALKQGPKCYREVFDERSVIRNSKLITGILGRIARTLKIPAVMVVPEFNLADWRDHVAPALLKFNATKEWFEIKAEAEWSCASRQWGNLERLALRLREIDAGLTSESGWLLAQAALARGNMGEARTHLEAARDSFGGLPLWSPPRCGASTQAVFRSAEKRYGMKMVDVPYLLAKRGEIPGRKYFMDYCHMAAPGIAITMEAVAETVLGISGRAQRRQNLEGRAEELAPVDPAVMASAHVLAATHNALLGQPEEILSYHCQQALRADPAVEGLLMAYLRSRASPNPEWLDDELAQQSRTSNARRYLIREIHAPEGRPYPYNLLEVARRLLPAEQFRPSLENIRKELLSPPVATRLDLLDPRFHSENAVPSSRIRHYVAKGPRTEFRFICPPTPTLMLTLCCRASHGADGQKSLKIYWGSKEIWSGPLGKQWKKIEVEICNDSAADAISTLALTWPAFAEDGAESRDAAQRSIDRGELPDVFPTWGEIHSFHLAWPRA